jgi:ATP-dependent DNA ligase
MSIPFWPGRPLRVNPDSDLFNSLVTDPSYAVEYKLDGFRCIVHWTESGVFGWTRHGRSQILVPSIRAALAKLEIPVGTAIDAELMGPRVAGTPQCLVAFDLPFWDGAPDATSTYEARRARLQNLRLPVVAQLPNTQKSFRQALVSGHEGLVLKRRDSAYPFAAGPVEVSTTAWLKVKAPTVNGRLIERVGT